MGKRYHCDFCGKSFQDNPQSRKRHLNGISHQRNRRLHYESVMGTHVVRGTCTLSNGGCQHARTEVDCRSVSNGGGLCVCVCVFVC